MNPKETKNMQSAIKRIQARLKKLGISKTSQQIREVYTATLGQNENPTEQEIITVMEKLSGDADNQITQVKETVDITPLEENHQLVDKPINESENIPKHSLTTTTTSALTYSNDFSKALAVQKVSDENKLVLSQEQIYNVAQSLPNSFEDYTDFVGATLAIFEEIFESDNLQAVNLASETLERIRNNRNQSRHVIYSNIEKTFNSMRDDDIANIKQITKLNELAKSFKTKGSKKNG